MIQSRMDVSHRRMVNSPICRTSSSIKTEVKSTPFLTGYVYVRFTFRSSSPEVHYSTKDLQIWGVRKGDPVSVSAGLDLSITLAVDILPSVPVVLPSKYPYSVDGLEQSLDLAEDADMWTPIEGANLAMHSSSNLLYLSSIQLP